MLLQVLPSTDHDTDNTSCDWRAIDRTLRGLARQRAALDAEEARWLRAGYRVQIWREVGCVSMIDYMERYLGYGVRNAQERLRVALALAHLPAITGALAAGQLPFSAVRTLLRVATPATEQQWLAHCADRSVHQIEDAVSGRKPGDLPTDPAQPDLELRTLRYSEVRPSTVALAREALARARAARGGELSDDEFLAMVFGAFLEGSAPAVTEATAGRAKHQVAVVVCERCDQGWRESAGKRFALDASELARVRCDAQHIGSLGSAAPSRATQDVPPRIRRLVWRRDRGRCTIDGCRSAANLEVHHIIAREDGGSHDPGNLTLACDGCHAAIHRGLITVTGEAPDAIVVTRKHAPRAHVCAPVAFDRVTVDADAKAALVAAGAPRGDTASSETPAEAVTNAHPPHAHVRAPTSFDRVTLDVDAKAARVQARPSSIATNPGESANAEAVTWTHARRAHVRARTSFDRVALDVDAKAALVQAGFSRSEAAAAVAAARARLGDDVLLEALLREALRRCRKPT